MMWTGRDVEVYLLPLCTALCQQCGSFSTGIWEGAFFLLEHLLYNLQVDALMDELHNHADHVGFFSLKT